MFLSLSLLLFSATACLETIDSGLRWGKRLGSAEAWKTLALQGDPEAQYKVGTNLCCGDRPEYDNVQAMFWFCKAAKQNQRDALLTIGELYEHAHEYEGTIVPRNNTMALTYYALSVKNGNDNAVEPYKKLEPKLSEGERRDVAMLLEKWPNIACEVYR